MPRATSYWNQPDGERLLAPTSWVPAYRSAWMDQQKLSTLSSSYFPTDNQFWGEGLDIHDVNGNGKPDYVHAVVAGPYNSGHNVFYQVGFDLGPTGVPQDNQRLDPDLGFDRQLYLRAGRRRDRAERQCHARAGARLGG